MNNKLKYSIYGLSLIIIFGMISCGDLVDAIDEDTSTDVPSYLAGGISFTDTDYDADEIGGTLNITKAVNEERITHYVLYWGSDSTTKLSPINEIAKTGSNIIHNISMGTPKSASATHFLVFTKNQYGEMATCISMEIVDTIGPPPVNQAEGVSFTDTDMTLEKLGGTVQITKAADESDITHYVLYWGSDATTKSGSAISELLQTGEDRPYLLSANTTIPDGATHFLVFTKNQYGEMATCVSVSFIDRFDPAVTASAISFTDTDIDYNEIEGTVTITAASDEFTITHYVLYWGSDSTTKLGSAVSEIAKTGSDVTYIFTENTAIPDNATHLLVFTKNQLSEMSTGVSCEIVDTQYALRDTGPAGGLIFYINPNVATDGWRFLEAAPYGWYNGGDDPEFTWGTYGESVGATGTAIGNGLANTTNLYNNYESTQAAQRCVGSNSGGYSDWFLPSSNELYRMYLNLRSETDENSVNYTQVGGFSNASYWSSSESSIYNASRRVFDNVGALGTLTKNSTARVRAVRRF